MGNAIAKSTKIRLSNRSSSRPNFIRENVLYLSVSTERRKAKKRNKYTISPLFPIRWSGEEKKSTSVAFFSTSDSVNSLCREILHFCEKVRIAGKGCIAVLLGGKLTEVQKTFLSFLPLSLVTVTRLVPSWQAHRPPPRRKKGPPQISEPPPPPDARGNILREVPKVRNYIIFKLSVPSCRGKTKEKLIDKSSNTSGNGRQQ